MKIKEYIKIAELGDVIQFRSSYRIVHEIFKDRTNKKLFTLWAEVKNGKWTRGICMAGDIYLEENGEESVILIFTNFINKDNKKFMSNTMSKVRELFRKEPEKTFIKSGFMDDSENITDDGKEVLMSILWKEKEKELKEIADKIVGVENTK
jgi:hypothetical protein